jgi:asparagine synthase (glutamine-hydrolysing)
LRHVLNEVLPHSPLRRAKTAFRVPAATWLRRPLAPLLRRQVESGSLYRDGWFKREPIARMVEEHTSGRSDWTHILWPLLTLGLWTDRMFGLDA